MKARTRKATHRNSVGNRPGSRKTDLAGLLAAAQRHQLAGRRQEAEAFYRQVLALDPDNGEALCRLGTLLHQRGENRLASDVLARGVVAHPASFELHFVHGVVLHALGMLAEAAGEYRLALELRPAAPEPHNNLGVIIQGGGDPAAACRHFEAALATNPAYADAWTNYGTALLQMGRIAEAAEKLRRALQHAPRSAVVHKNLGESLRRLGRPGQAVAHLEEALRLSPDFADAHNVLGVVLQSLGQVGSAEGHLREAIRLQPGSADSHNNLGLLLQSKGDLDGAIAEIRRSLELRPGDALTHCNLLFAMNYHPALRREEVFAEMRRWAARHAAPLATSIRPHPNTPEPRRRLRIGYVSPDFRSHPVSFFIEPILAGFDRENFEIFCYSNHSAADHVTERLRGFPTVWRDIYGMPDDEAAALVRRDGIDILVDLAGHSGQNRLLLFARKPAPVQITYLGNPDSTGLDVINYRITDGHCDPAGRTEHVYSEELIRLPHSFFCYRPPAEAPAVEALPALSRGYVTFGSFNNLAKISEGVLSLWASILRKVPGSHLLFQSKGLSDRETCRKLRDFFAAEGIDPGRIETAAYTSFAEHLALLGKVDIALDPFPWNGHTTTCHTLWMGVPTVALEGEFCISRMGVSVLSSAGLPELIASSGDEYSARLVELAGDLPRLESLRSTMRRRLLDSPLTAAPEFNRNIEAVYRRLWQRWCAVNGAGEREKTVSCEK